ncbi:MAG: (2Fe-2S)-binding protein [Candidatus Dormibacteraeota bacterium]|nr:(2Fe-2S)-binding protein [Candidatus Dormibacteraeota bacterium]
MRDEQLEVRLGVNGAERAGLVAPRKLLADFLRDDLRLTGTHLGCEHGVCGACTVLLNGRAVRSCLLFAVQASGCEVRTVEGLAEGGELHPLQRAISERHGLQCGFCTPGVLLAAVDLLDVQPRPSEAEVREAMSGNLCRCTGYEGIVAAVLQAAEELARR